MRWPKYGWEVLNFYGKCLKVAFGGAYGFVSWATTGLGALSWWADQHPGALGDTWAQRFHDAGGYGFLGIIFLSVAIARLILAPYRIYKEQADRLARFELPVVAEILEPIDRGLITVKVSNHTDTEQRVATVFLSLLSLADEIELSMGRQCFSKSRRIVKLPYSMPLRSSFELAFTHSVNGFLQYGVKSFYAVLEMEIGPNVVSATKDISHRLRADCHVARRLKENLERDARINGFASTYISERTMPIVVDNEFQSFIKAGVLNLCSTEEIEEALALIEEKQINHPFKLGFSDVDILGFFNQESAHIKSESEIDLGFRLFYWKSPEAKLPLRVADTEEPKPEPSSPECPETSL